MIGQKFASSPLQEYIISVMMEAVKIKVDESGAKVESRAVMMAKRCKKTIIEVPR